MTYFCTFIFAKSSLNLVFFFKFQVEVGDVILKVNETDVKRFSTKEGNAFAYE